MAEKDIFSYIQTQENAFETEEVQLGDNWSWNMRIHVQMIFHLMNSQFYTGKNDWMRSFKNIMEPLIDLANWTEDIEVKDIVFFIENDESRVFSFLLKKYHDEVYVREHNLDEFIDEITEQDNTYGGIITQKTNDPKPETLELNRLAFCDQTNIVGGPMFFKYSFSPDGLRKMSERGWGEESNGATISLDELVELAQSEKDSLVRIGTKKNKTPGKVIDVYVGRGNLPEHYLDDSDNFDDWYNQVHVVAFYTDKKNNKKGVSLYRKKEDESTIKFFTAKPVSGRGLGRGVGEQLLPDQIWTNWVNINKHELLKAASKVIPYTDDENFSDKNNLQDVDNLEIMKVGQGRTFGRVPTVGSENYQLFDAAVNEWFAHAQLSASAQDPILGKEAVSGTTFRGQERTVAQGRGPHDRKRGKRAKFIEEIYRDWIIPQMIKEITKGKEFIATLSSNDISWVVDQLATNYANGKITERMMDFSKPIPTKQEQDELKRVFKEQFTKQGNKSLVSIIKDEYRGKKVNIGINVANKQKDLANLSDKILSIFQFIFANPQAFQQAMQIPSLAKSFHDILEFSGLNQADFMSLIQPPSSVPVESPIQPPQLQLNAQNGEG